MFKSIRILIIAFSILFFSNQTYSQGCCSGGSGSPIAGGASQGVLQDRQFEIGVNYQYINTNKFKFGSEDTSSLFKDFNSNYIYLRLAYGITKNLTMSVESGYFINKTQIELDNVTKVKSSGIADLILFPRYDILNITTVRTRTEITVGVGVKIPLGKYNDSSIVYTNPTTGAKTYSYLPPILQPTNGSNDFIFYGFFYRGYPIKNFRIFSNVIYIRKGWNSLGQKFGDYASVGIFAGMTFFKKLGVTLQVKGEWIDKMQADKNVDMLAYYNVDINSTGGEKVFVVPQLSFSHKDFTIYASTEIPIYQHLNKLQIASQYQATIGVSYRFFAYKDLLKKKNGQVLYVCPMDCPGSASNKPGKCKECGMDLIKK